MRVFLYQCSGEFPSLFNTTSTLHDSLVPCVLVSSAMLTFLFYGRGDSGSTTAAPAATTTGGGGLVGALTDGLNSVGSAVGGLSTALDPTRYAHVPSHSASLRLILIQFFILFLFFCNYFIGFFFCLDGHACILVWYEQQRVFKDFLVSDVYDLFFNLCEPLFDFSQHAIPSTGHSEPDVLLRHHLGRPDFDGHQHNCCGCLCHCNSGRNARFGILAGMSRNIFGDRQDNTAA